jgi:hypothetical protein
MERTAKLERAVEQERTELMERHPMTPPLRLTWHQAYAGGRIVAKLGDIEVGAVFPRSYAWRFWLGNVTTPRQDGSAKSELAAKSALTARVADWLRDAGLQQVPDA